jgi:hypothetical protein
MIALRSATLYAYYLLSKNYIEVISNDPKGKSQIVECQMGIGNVFSLYIPYN